MVLHIICRWGVSSRRGKIEIICYGLENFVIHVKRFCFYREKSLRLDNKKKLRKY